MTRALKMVYLEPARLEAETEAIRTPADFRKTA